MGGRGEAAGGAADNQQQLWQLSFPPFYTLQPHAETRRKQLDTWAGIVLDYCRKHRLTSVDTGELANAAAGSGGSGLFANEEIKRRASDELLDAVWQHLEARGNLEWVDNTKKTGSKKAHIYWRAPEAWADLIYSWVKASGMTNGTVCTFFELTEGADTVDQPFHGLDTDVLIKSLKLLQSRGKAELFQGDEGVKFF